MNGPTARTWDAWSIPLALCFILTVLFACTHINNFDLGTDLRTGQWILQNHSFPQKDVFTYTVNQNDYLDGKVLYQLGLYLLYSVLGYTGISVLNLLLVLGTVLLLYLRLKLTHSPPWLSCMLLFIVLLGTERRFFIRAEIVSWVLMGLELLILEWRFRGKRDLLAWLPVIQWLWIDVEGLFILGWILLGAYNVSQWLHRGQVDRKLLKWSLVSLGVGLLNPYGWKLLALPFIYLGEFQGSGNSDLVSPLRYLANQNLKIDWNLHLFVYFAFCLALGLLVLWTRRRRTAHDWILMTVFFGLSCIGYRNIPLFFWVTVPIAASAWVEGARGSTGRWSRVDGFLGSHPRAPKAAMVLLVLLCLRVFTNAYYVSDRRMTRLGLGLDTEKIPVKAAEFLSQNHLDGRLLNDMDSGDWLVWKGPQPVFIDGRQQVMGNQFYREYLDSFQAGGLARLIGHYQPKLIALQYNDSAPWAIQLKFLPNWRMIYADESFALYAEKGYAESFGTFYFATILPQAGVFLTPEQVSTLIGTTQPSRLKNWLEGFYRPQNYPHGLMSLGLLALHYEDYETANLLFAESLKEAGGGFSEIFFNLGVANLHLNQLPLGKTCLQKALELDPGNHSTLQMLDSLRSI